MAACPCCPAFGGRSCAAPGGSAAAAPAPFFFQPCALCAASRLRRCACRRWWPPARGGRERGGERAVWGGEREREAADSGGATAAAPLRARGAQIGRRWRGGSEARSDTRLLAMRGPPSGAQSASGRARKESRAKSSLRPPQRPAPARSSGLEPRYGESNGGRCSIAGVRGRRGRRRTENRGASLLGFALHLSSAFLRDTKALESDSHAIQTRTCSA